ncbi:ATP-binding protein [Gilvimarinus algae]|uniref:histidine kinase n=1 Tax=Gilvimarinus algae TaxID=3058037 RepID=A0ABT8TE69_9GAMM|nr:ATP-binding protein [Gilvimarinus sp. SDUM040014]MDO3381683.1 CHASE domain-containing protein [Gilvimarinus sp. SDUM040014]
MKLVVHSLLLALAYIVIGRLALLLAIPPGFATALFPPIGIALGALLLFGYRLLPGVLLGSFVLNLSISYSSGGEVSQAAFATALGIALGSCAAIALAKFAITRYLKGRSAFASDRDTAVIFALAGPFACAVSATLCSWVLLKGGVIGAPDYPYTWWTWWLGDSIGMLLALPLMYILFAEPRELWRERWLSVGIPMLVACGLMVLIFLRINRAELEKIDQAFAQQSMPFSANLQARLKAQIGVLRSIDGLFRASSHVAYSDFVNFTGNALSDNPEIHALSWNTYIRHSERVQAEQALLQRGLPGVITERGEGASLVTAPRRDDYIFVNYIAPYTGNEKAQSFNVGSVANRREALVRAAQSNTARATPPIYLVQDSITRPALLVFYPVYKDESGPHSLDNVRGFATSVVVMDQVLGQILEDYPEHRGFSVALDYLDGDTDEVLAERGERNLSRLSPFVSFTQTFEFAGRQFRLRLQPTQLFIAQHQSLLTWTVLAGGFLFCALLGGFLLSLSIRSELVRQLVRERTAELSSILNSATDAILTLDGEGRIRRCNHAATALLGQSQTQLEGQAINRWLPALSDAAQDLEQSLASGGNRIFDTFVASANGDWLAVELSVSTVEFGRYHNYVLMLHDISERKKTERMKSEFISTVSHELRTPLTSIGGALKLMEAGVAGKLPEEAARLTGIARSNTERLRVLVNDILDVEKLDVDQMKFHITSVPVREHFEHIVQQNKAYANGFDVELVLDVDDSVDQACCVLADRDRLNQIMTNLLSNAVKYSPAHSQVKVRLEVQGRQLVISVRDTGRGMPEYFRKHIFQRFSQADSSDTREKSGTGLGLYITKMLTEKMSGQIDYTSELGKGSEFFVRLPLSE